jgi:hypothetical protein
MPHASTSYVGARDSGGLKKIFGLDDLVGDSSTYAFELRKWDGRSVLHALYHCCY